MRIVPGGPELFLERHVFLCHGSARSVAKSVDCLASRPAPRCQTRSTARGFRLARGYVLVLASTPQVPMNRPDVPDHPAAETAAAAELRQHLEEVARDRDQAYRALQEREAELARIQRIGRVGGMEVDLREGFRNRRSPEYLIIHGLPPE